MLFIKSEELKPGMRLAKPIYNKKGVLLYDRAAVLRDEKSIENIKSFGLIGLFILEPAEPVPPMTQDDLDFEQFQTVVYNEIMEELQKIIDKRKQDKFPFICAKIIKKYGNLRKKITFQQSLRSTEDYIYKHSLNVAILSAMITHTMNVPLSDQNEVVMASVIHDIGKLTLPPEYQSRKLKQSYDRALVDEHEQEGYKIIEYAFASLPNLRRVCNQARKILLDFDEGIISQNRKMFMAARVLTVAGYYDRETAVRLDESPVSEIVVIKTMMEHSEVFDPKVVKALIDSLNILVPGISVVLNNGEKALVLRINEYDFLRPTVLSFTDNSIIDLSNRRTYGKLEIVDIMKTMDNRYVMDVSRVKAMGINVEEPEYI
ncbi:MAG: HD domain-containing protein [Butyrivibrio sp.]|nr:HD domain-containing protein [Butyrivibrio sp.]